MFSSQQLKIAMSCLAVALFAGATVAHPQSASTSVLSPSPATGSAVSTAEVSAAVSKPAPADNPLNGLNLGVTENLESDSSTGWSDFLTPDLSWRVNRHLSFDAGFPWYLSLAAYQPTTVNGVTTTSLTHVQNVIGDTALSAHAGGSHNDFNFSGGAVVGFATGDKSLGVSAGQTTYHLGTHTEYSLGPFTPDIEAGIGNSSAFADHLVRKSYTAVGEIANFQGGTSVDLPRKFSLDLEAYEAMPVQLANIFGTIGRRANHGHAGGKKTVQGASGSAEDNGFTVDLSLPVTRKLAFSADYEHSIIQADNIVGFSLAWTLRTPKKLEARTPASPLSHPGN